MEPIHGGLTYGAFKEIDMPFITQWIDPELFMEHNGVRVFRTYKDDDVGQGCKDYWFTLNNNSDEDAFDVRELDVPSRKNLEAHPPFLYGSHFEAASKEQREVWGKEWHDWLVTGEKEAIRQIIIEAIDVGQLSTEEEGCE